MEWRGKEKKEEGRETRREEEQQGEERRNFVYIYVVMGSTKLEVLVFLLRPSNVMP